MVLREALDEGGEVLGVFGCDDCFDVVCDFDPAFSKVPSGP